MTWYNGFSPNERKRMPGRVRLENSGETLPAEAGGPCMICGDPEVPVEPHAEDYSKPYRWTPPSAYWLCHSCHVKLHSRFSKPSRWKAFLAHVNRGGYSRDLKEREIEKEVNQYERAVANGHPIPLRPLREVSQSRSRWFASLTLDPACIEPGFIKPERNSIVDRFDWSPDNVTFTPAKPL